MRKRVKLIAGIDEEFGTCGLYVEGCGSGTNAATDPLQIAHDLVEHVNGVDKIGSIDDELEALGAIWFVRGQYNDLRRNGKGNPDVYVNIAADIVRMFRDFFSGQPVSLRQVRTLECEADDAFRTIIEEAKAQCLDELDRADRNEVEAMQKRTDYLRICLPRMRIGYRKAKRKYKRGMVANNLFWQIVEALEQPMRGVEEHSRFWLSYGIDAEGGTYARATEIEYGED